MTGSNSSPGCGPPSGTEDGNFSYATAAFTSTLSTQNRFSSSRSSSPRSSRSLGATSAILVTSSYFSLEKPRDMHWPRSVSTDGARLCSNLHTLTHPWAKIWTNLGLMDQQEFASRSGLSCPIVVNSTTTKWESGSREFDEARKVAFQRWRGLPACSKGGLTSHRFWVCPR